MSFAKYYLLLTCVYEVIWLVRLAYMKLTNKLPFVSKAIPLWYLAVVPILIWPAVMVVDFVSAIRGRFMFADQLAEIEKELR